MIRHRSYYGLGLNPEKSGNHVEASTSIILATVGGSLTCLKHTTLHCGTWRGLTRSPDRPSPTTELLKGSVAAAWVWSTRLEPFVALQFLPENLAQDKNAMERFR